MYAYVIHGKNIFSFFFHINSYQFSHALFGNIEINCQWSLSRRRIYRVFGTFLPNWSVKADQVISNRKAMYHFAKIAIVINRPSNWLNCLCKWARGKPVSKLMMTLSNSWWQESRLPLTGGPVSHDATRHIILLHKISYYSPLLKDFEK